jgi:hypothetical protein
MIVIDAIEELLRIFWSIRIVILRAQSLGRECSGHGGLAPDTAGYICREKAETWAEEGGKLAVESEREIDLAWRGCRPVKL